MSSILQHSEILSPSIALQKHDQQIFLCLKSCVYPFLFLWGPLVTFITGLHLWVGSCTPHLSFSTFCIFGQVSSVPFASSPLLLDTNMPHDIHLGCIKLPCSTFSLGKHILSCYCNVFLWLNNEQITCQTQASLLDFRV